MMFSNSVIKCPLIFWYRHEKLSTLPEIKLDIGTFQYLSTTYITERGLSNAKCFASSCHTFQLWKHYNFWGLRPTLRFLGENERNLPLNAIIKCVSAASWPSDVGRKRAIHKLRHKKRRTKCSLIDKVDTIKVFFKHFNPWFRGIFFLIGIAV